jgi:hypothetical protein
VDVIWRPWQATTAFRWVAGLIGVPDVPHTLLQRSQNHGLNSGIQCVGKTEKARPENENNSLSAIKQLTSPTSINSNEPQWITFNLNENHRWEALIYGGKLYLQIGDHGLPEGSKEAMTELLELAEETLKLGDVIITFNKHRTDRLQVTRTFMYLGFESLAPNNSLVPTELVHPDLFYMVYSF